MIRRASAIPAVVFLLAALPGCSTLTVVSTSAPTMSTPTATDVATADAAPPACTAVGQQWNSPADGMTLVCVPAGTFLMGAADDDPDAKADAKPRHQVTLSAFWIDQTEVTNAEFALCVAAEICPARPALAGATGVASKTHATYYYDSAFAEYPVLIYTPEEAAIYCACMGRRLPTEAEWEHAAGGPGGTRYPWGDTLDCDHASYLDCTADTTNVEGPLIGASVYGAVNMAGNVAEWVADFYAAGYDLQAPGLDPTGPSTGDLRVRRGGGFASLAHDLLVTTRISGNPSHYFDSQMGFRCAQSPP